MDLSYGPEAEAYRTEVRDFLSARWRPADASRPDLTDYIRAFRLDAIDRGYLYRGVPRAYGGGEQKQDVVRAQVIREEFQSARAPMEVAGVGASMLVPTLLECGSAAQKEMFIRPTLLGEWRWGQGYSEPGAGSDLAAVRTHAKLVGDEWIINGQKIWTTHGDVATHMFALVRTEPDAGKHGGISYLLIELDQPGVERRPIRQMTGAEGFFEFFFADARAPLAWTVGKRGEGWAVSRTTLRHERASIASGDRLREQFDKLVALAREMRRNGRPAIEDAAIRQSLATIEGWVMAHRCSNFRLFSHAAADEPPGPLHLMMKVLTTDIGHDIARVALDLLGNAALLEPPPAGAGQRGPEKWLDQIMGSVGNSIAGGASNIHRNIIAEQGLRLPRDPSQESER